MTSNRYEQEDYYQTDRHAFPSSPPRKTAVVAPTPSSPLPNDADDNQYGDSAISKPGSSSNSSTTSGDDESSNDVRATPTILSHEEQFYTPPKSVDPLLRKWTPTRDHPSDPDAALVALATEVDLLDGSVEQMKEDVRRLRAHGRHKRHQRWQQLEALETKRLTLTEILRRMDKELNEKDVYDYGDILAATFGSRKIYAHRAIGLESLLFQFMHQMLAKQHQLKIMKRAGKDLQSIYKTHRNHVRDEYHSYQALTVQMEASRLSLETVYEDLFTSQHSLLSQLLWVLQNPVEYDKQQLLRNATNSNANGAVYGANGLKRPSRMNKSAMTASVEEEAISVESQETIELQSTDAEMPDQTVIAKGTPVTVDGLATTGKIEASSSPPPQLESETNSVPVIDSTMDDQQAVLAILQAPAKDEASVGSATSSLSSSRAPNSLASKASEIYAISRMRRSDKGSSENSLASSSSGPNTPPLATITPLPPDAPSNTSAKQGSTSLSKMARERLRLLEQQRMAIGKGPMRPPSPTPPPPATITPVTDAAPKVDELPAPDKPMNARDRMRILEESRKPGSSFKSISEGSDHSEAKSVSPVGAPSIVVSPSPPSSPATKSPSPPGSPEAAQLSPPGSPETARLAPPGSPETAGPSPPGSSETARLTPPGSPATKSQSPPGSPETARLSPSGSPEAARLSPPVSPAILRSSSPAESVEESGAMSVEASAEASVAVSAASTVPTTNVSETTEATTTPDYSNILQVTALDEEEPLDPELYNSLSRTVSSDSSSSSSSFGPRTGIEV